MQLSDVEDTYHSYHTARLHMHMRTDLERRVPSNLLAPGDFSR